MVIHIQLKNNCLSCDAIGGIRGSILAYILLVLLITLFFLLHRRRNNHCDHFIVTHDREVNEGNCRNATWHKFLRWRKLNKLARG
jgi:hypothetical protein